MVSNVISIDVDSSCSLLRLKGLFPFPYGFERHKISFRLIKSDRYSEEPDHVYQDGDCSVPSAFTTIKELWPEGPPPKKIHLLYEFEGSRCLSLFISVNLIHTDLP